MPSSSSRDGSARVIYNISLVRFQGRNGPLYRNMDTEG